MSRKLSYDGNLKPRAQQLRREMTSQERRLWYEYLRGCPVQFRRQKQFGYYIVDFYCAACNLVIEIDGSQHFDPEATLWDEMRTEYLNGLGIKVMRFSNFEVDRHFDAVCEAIYMEIDGKMRGG